MAYETIIEDGIDILVVGAGLGGPGAAKTRTGDQNVDAVFDDRFVSHQ